MKKPIWISKEIDGKRYSTCSITFDYQPPDHDKLHKEWLDCQKEMWEEPGAGETKESAKKRVNNSLNYYIDNHNYNPFCDINCTQTKIEQHMGTGSVFHHPNFKGSSVWANAGVEYPFKIKSLEIKKNCDGSKYLDIWMEHK